MIRRRARVSALSLCIAVVGFQPAHPQFGPPRQVLSAQCTFNDECAQPLVCAGHFCRQQCRTDRDCANGWVCQQQVWSNTGGDGSQNRFLEVYAPYSPIPVQPGVYAAARGDLRGVCVAPAVMNPGARIQPGPGGGQSERPDQKKDPKAYLGSILQGLADQEKAAAEARARSQEKP